MNTAGLLTHQIEPSKRLLEALSLHNAALDASSTGVGKCLGKEVLVRMYDGTTKRAEWLTVGDLLMGDDGTPRRVLATSVGFGPMFKITPKRGGGGPWRCNGDHILVLKSTGSHAKYRGWVKGEEREMAVQDLLKLPKSTQSHRWKMFSTSGWDRPFASLPFDPYIYGLWLGDGGRAGGVLTTMDLEISQAWTNYFEGLGYRIWSKKDSRNRASAYIPRYNAVGEYGKYKSPWSAFFHSSCLGEEKIILADYLHSSRTQRLELLAGLLDTDGHLCNGLNTFEIAVKGNQMSEQIRFLALSLGFTVSSKKKVVKPIPGNGGGVYNRMCISGQTSEVPTRLLRKRASIRSEFKTLRVFGFDISSDGEDFFYGVVTDGNRRFLLADGTITHNSYVSAAIIRHLELPTLCIVPKISITAWGRVLDYMGTSACVRGWEAIRTGNLPYGSWQHPLPPASERRVDYFCTGCQCRVDVIRTSRCPVRPSGIHCVETKKAVHNYGRFTFNEAVKFLVLDEIHAASGLDSLNSDLVIAARRQNIPTLGLSATCADSPLHMRALGYLLGLHCLTNFYPWAMRHNVRRPVWGGLEFYGSDEKKRQVMGKIHESIFPSRGVRVRTSDIPDFPACKIDAELFDLESSGKLAELYQTMEDAIDLLNKIKLTDKDATHPLTVLLRSSMEIELLKLPIFLALRQDALDEGKSVALFVQYRQSLEELQRRTKAPAIYGSQHPNERQAAIDDFQAEKEHTILVNIAAGGVAVSLHHCAPGVRPRVGVCSLHPSATKTRQMLGRLARAGGLSPARYRIPLVANTPEERLHKRLNSKLGCLDALLDSDLTACSLPLTVGDLSEILTETP